MGEKERELKKTKEIEKKIAGERTLEKCNAEPSELHATTARGQVEVRTHARTHAPLNVPRHRARR